MITMRSDIYHRSVFLGLMVGAMFLFSFAMETAWAEEVYDCNAEENRKKSTRVEITLSKKLKKKEKEVKAAFSSLAGNARIRVGFFPFLDPPMNIGIGKCITAEMARLAITQATTYNGGVTYLILQNVLPHHWIGIGTTHMAELSWVPITPGNLERLKDLALSTEEFHALYRALAKMKERKQPFGMDPIPLPPE